MAELLALDCSVLPFILLECLPFNVSLRLFLFYLNLSIVTLIAPRPLNWFVVDVLFALRTN